MQCLLFKVLKSISLKTVCCCFK